MSGPARNLGGETQAGVYVRGLGGVRPQIPTAFSALEAAAREKLSAEAWAYAAGGAGLESTMASNRAAFEHRTDHVQYKVEPFLVREPGDRGDYRAVEVVR